MGLEYLIGAVIGAVVGLIGTGVNMYETEKTNKENKEYATQMTTAQWQRDDTSLQRQVEDAKLAGLSPLAVTGSMNSSSPLNYVAQAPQMDLSSLMGLGASVSQMELQRGEKKQEIEQHDKDLVHDLYKFNKQLEANQQLQDDQLTQDIIKFNKTLAYQYNELNEMSLQNAQQLESDRLINLSKQTMEVYADVASTVGMAPRVEYVTDYKEYIEKFNSYMIHYKELLNDPYLVDTGKITSESTSESMSSSALKNGVSFSDSSSYGYNLDSAVLRDLYSKYLKDYAIPILVDDKKFLSREYKPEE